MRTLIEYIRSCFCKHDWELIFSNTLAVRSIASNRIKVYRCKKCGYSKRYKAMNW